MINVTKSVLPPLEEYMLYLKGIWERGQLTNHGPLVLELEEKLRMFLNVKHLYFLSNGTVALQIAIKALNLKGEIITTPFSYVATTSSIVWENCEPIFVDIEPDSLTIDPNLIEDKITENTSAILATHVYGNPCDVLAIQKIANAHNLKVIYDAAHAFGVKYRGSSILEYGDFSTLSFHATKLFHTVEGGAIVTNNPDLAHKASYLRNFGHNGQEEFFGLGINGKNSEFHAAMGLCLLPMVKDIISCRKKISEKYDELLKDLPISKPKIRDFTEYNYAYYPVLFENEKTLLRVRANLNKKGIFPRRYFYPSLSKLPYVLEQSVPISEDVSKRVLCLPLFPDLRDDQIVEIATTVGESL
jgi:dTDP-4-amino-4,6-dideoxygalactose transaminase